MLILQYPLGYRRDETITMMLPHECVVQGVIHVKGLGVILLVALEEGSDERIMRLCAFKMVSEGTTVKNGRIVGTAVGEGVRAVYHVFELPQPRIEEVV